MADAEPARTGRLLGGPDNIYRPTPRTSGNPPRWSRYICTRRPHDAGWHHFAHRGDGDYVYVGLCDEPRYHRGG